MLKNETCVKLCDVVIPQEDAGFMAERIREGYSINYLVDGLPVAQQVILEDTHEICESTAQGLIALSANGHCADDPLSPCAHVQVYSIGFHLGATHSAGREEYKYPALHNHYDIRLEYHRRSANEFRIVGASVWPASRDSLAAKDGTLDCNAAMPVFLNTESTNGTAVAYTYTTHWVESNTPWATRWDHYLKVVDPKIHWLSLVNAIVIVSFLCLLVSPRFGTSLIVCWPLVLRTWCSRSSKPLHTKKGLCGSDALYEP